MIERNIMLTDNEIKHETLTANISKLGVCGLFKVCTFNNNFNGMTSKWHGNPSQLILANRYGLF